MKVKINAISFISSCTAKSKPKICFSGPTNEVVETQNDFEASWFIISMSFL